MVDKIITRQELVDAQKDAQTLEDVINGAPNVLIETRLGRKVYTIASIPQINTMSRDEIEEDLAQKADLALLPLKADKVDTFTKTEVTGLIAPKADKIYVDSAVGAISTDGSKQYATLALATADIANIPLNKNIFVSEAANGGYWYKATAGATSLTKSPYDPLTQAKADATTKADAAKAEAIAKAATLSSIGEWLTEDGKTTLSTLNTSNASDANKLKVIRTIEKIALLNASSSERFYIQSVLRNQGVNGSRIHVQRESQLGTNNRVASLIIADTVTTAGVQEYTVDGTDGIKLKILVNWDNFETNTSALNVNLPINNLKFLKEFQNESQLSNVAAQISVAKAEAISASATDATSKASAAETNAKNYTDQFFNQFLINEGASWES